MKNPIKRKANALTPASKNNTHTAGNSAYLFFNTYNINDLTNISEHIQRKAHVLQSTERGLIINSM